MFDLFIECIFISADLLPTPPMFITGEAISPTRIFIKWSAPVENPEKVTAFKLFYQRDGDIGYSSVSILLIYPYTTYLTIYHTDYFNTCFVFHNLKRAFQLPVTDTVNSYFVVLYSIRRYRGPTSTTLLRVCSRRQSTTCT